MLLASQPTCCAVCASLSLKQCPMHAWRCTMPCIAWLPRWGATAHLTSLVCAPCWPCIRPVFVSVLGSCPLLATVVGGPLQWIHNQPCYVVAGPRTGAALGICEPGTIHAASHCGPCTGSPGRRQCRGGAPRCAPCMHSSARYKWAPPAAPLPARVQCMYRAKGGGAGRTTTRACAGLRLRGEAPVRCAPAPGCQPTQPGAAPACPPTNERQQCMGFVGAPTPRHLLA